MSPVVSVVWVVLVILCALLTCALVALSEMGDARAQSLIEQGGPRTKNLVELVDHRSLIIAPLQLLKLALLIVLGLWVGRVGLEGRNTAATIGFVVGLLLILMLFVELLPQNIARRNADRIAPAAASFARLILSFPPVKLLLQGILWLARTIDGNAVVDTTTIANEDEFVALADAAVEAEVLDNSEGEIIQSLVDFGDTIVREAMVPRPDVLAASAGTTVSDAIAMLVDSGVSRMPVFGDDVDDVRGIVHIKDLYARLRRGRGDHFVTIALRKPYFVPETKRAAELLAELRMQPQSMVIVVDEYGGTAGIVTMEDLIEEILGDIVDEFDLSTGPLHEPLRAGEWRVHGRIPVDEFNELLGTDLPDEDWDTLGGLIFDELGHVPVVGESISIDGYQLSVEEVDGRRIARVHVVRSGSVGDLEGSE